MAARRTVFRAAARIALLAPLLWTGAMLAAELHARPTGRAPVKAIESARTLPSGPGTILRIPLPNVREQYRSLVIRTAPTEAPRRLRCRLCVDSRCVTTEAEFGADGSLTLPVPEGIRGGVLELSVLRFDGPPAVFAGDLASPALEAVRGFSWSPSLARAREVAHAMAGADLFPAAILAYGAGLVGTLAIALTLAASGSAPRPAAHGEQDRHTRVEPSAP